MNFPVLNAKTSAKAKSAILRVVRPLLPNIWDRAYRTYRHSHYSSAGLIFCHIPKNAGSSIAFSLYRRRLGHMRLSQLISENKEGLPILAIWRDPVARFLSSCKYASGGGGTDGIIANAESYQKIRSVSEFLDHLEKLPDSERDPVFRTQSWYLDVLANDLHATNLTLCRVSELPKLQSLKWFRNLDFSAKRNASDPHSIPKTDDDLRRIRKLYENDFRALERYSEFFL
ncbi:MAG: hypothetical protein MK171_07815 [Pirellulales bacterium]|nr:hypothetical protein [Pirellulales bacterium]